MTPAASLVFDAAARRRAWRAQSGSATVSHDGGYGDVMGKAVALEPATGFAFDTPLMVRSR